MQATVFLENIFNPKIYLRQKRIIGGVILTVALAVFIITDGAAGSVIGTVLSIFVYLVIVSDILLWLRKLWLRKRKSA